MKTRTDEGWGHVARLPLVGFTLASIWPGATFVAHNASEFAWMDISAIWLVVKISVVLWLGGLLASALPRLLTRRWSVPRALTIATVSVFALFAHEASWLWLMNAFSMSGGAARLSYVGVVSLVLLCLWRLSRHTPVRVAVVIWTVVMLAFPIANLAVHTSRGGQATVSTAVVADRERGSQPRLSGRNVYYVIVDGYAGRSVLRKYFDANVDSFVTGMEALGFVSLDHSRSNYTTTFLSLMALLDMDYVVDEQSPRFKDRVSFFPLRLRFGPLPRLLTRLREGGYDFYHGASRWTPCVVRAEILCLAEGDAGFSAHVAGVFLSPTKIPLARLGLVRGENPGALATLGGVLDGLKSRGRPFFAFVHELSPHRPFRLADCSTAPIDQPLTTRLDASARRDYVHSIECLNVEILSQSQRILAQDPEAIVIFQADHGSDFEVDWKQPMAKWSDAAIDERSSVMNLVRLPASCSSWLRPNLSPVNTMRLVMACLEGRPPDYLADRTFLNNYEMGPDYGLVRDVSGVLADMSRAGGR